MMTFLHNNNSRVLLCETNTTLSRFMCSAKQTLFGCEPTICSVIIKKSRFVAHVVHADTFQHAMELLKKYSDFKATHNCWAYNSLTTKRSSDDGEPSGTAGRPMLSALENENIVNVLAIVTRYYGGVKLGTGGLARAYSGVVQSALKSAERIDIVPSEVIHLNVPLQDLGAIFTLLKPYEVLQNKDEDNEENESDDITLQSSTDSLNVSVDCVTVRAVIPLKMIDELRVKFTLLTKGKGDFQRIHTPDE